MGTKGIFGFRVNNTDYLTYNHFDSYPSGLGQDCLDAVKEIVKNRDINEVRRKIGDLQLVNESDAVSEELQEQYMSFTNLGVGEQSSSDWYCILREAQGQPLLWLDLLDHMIDHAGDKEYHPYAYVINLDTESFEIYINDGRNPQIISFQDCLKINDIEEVIEDE